MTVKMCRLCFEEKSEMIGIFTTKGVKLNVAIVIRAHFPDDVNKRIRLFGKKENYIELIHVSGQ